MSINKSFLQFRGLPLSRKARNWKFCWFKSLQKCFKARGCSRPKPSMTFERFSPNIFASRSLSKMWQMAFTLFLKMGQSRPLFVYFCYFHDTISIIQIEKSVDGLLGIRTQGRSMVSADKTTDLWQPLWHLLLNTDLPITRNQIWARSQFLLRHIYCDF